MFKSKINSVQSWLPIQDFYNDGIIKLKNNNLIKIIKVNPINYELRSEFEKETILNSYKAFLKNCNFDIQIIIQSCKENILPNINIIRRQKDKEKSLNNNFIVNLFDKYINYIKYLNQEKFSSSKKFYIILNSNNLQEKNEEKIIKELNEKYAKIKEALSRCENSTCEIKNKEELKNIIKSFFYKNVEKGKSDSK